MKYTNQLLSSTHLVARSDSSITCFVVCCVFYRDIINFTLEDKRNLTTAFGGVAGQGLDDLLPGRARGVEHTSPPFDIASERHDVRRRASSVKTL